MQGGAGGQPQATSNDIGAEGGSVTGGAIAVGTGTVEIAASRFDANQAIAGQGGPFNSNGFTGSGGFSDGGAVYSGVGLLTLSRSEFTGNQAIAGSGGNGGPGF